MTLTEFLQQQGCEGDVVTLCQHLGVAVKDIAEAIAHGDTGKAGTQNVFGEEQVALDVQAQDILERELKASGVVGLYASEEMDGESRIEGGGSLAVAFDPLDGSSLVDVNFSVGTIFAIFRTDSFLGKKGSEQVGAAIAVYGPRTTLFFTFGKGVHQCTLKEGEFHMTKENLTVAEEGKVFAPGSLQTAQKEQGYRNVVNYWLDSGYRLRYSGGMVPDVNHIFMKGKGIFSYPASQDRPTGKLRLLFECAPMALLMEAAGGASYAAQGQRTLDIEITDSAQTTPIFIGSAKEVEKALEVMNG